MNLQLQFAYLQLQINLHIQYIYLVKRHSILNKVLIFNNNHCKIIYALAVVYYIRPNNLQIL